LIDEKGYFHSNTTKRTIEKTIPVLSIIQNGGPWGTVPEPLFEKKGLIPAVQQMLVSYLEFVAKASPSK
jgi:hypothetical protein